MLTWGRQLPGEIFYVNIENDKREACSATFNLGTNSTLTLGPRKPTENHVTRLNDI